MSWAGDGLLSFNKTGTLRGSDPWLVKLANHHLQGFERVQILGLESSPLQHDPNGPHRLGHGACTRVLKPSTNGRLRVARQSRLCWLYIICLIQALPLQTQGSHSNCLLDGQRAAAGIRRAKRAAYMQGEVKRGQFNVDCFPGGEYIAKAIFHHVGHAFRRSTRLVDEYGEHNANHRMMQKCLQRRSL